MSDGLLLHLGPAGALLALLVAGHMLGDFVLQTGRMVQNKDRLWWLLFHVSVLIVAQTLAVFPFLSWNVILVMVGIGISHGLIDRVKFTLEKGYPHTLRVFLLDQTAHATVLLGAWLLLSKQLSPPSIFFFSEVDIPSITRAGVLVSVYAFNWNGGAAVVNGILRLCHFDQDGDDDESVAGGRGTGRMIGILERMMALTLVLVGEWGTLGLVLTAKSIARFKQLEQRNFAEYYLIGTLTSVLLAVASGLLAKLLV